MDKDTNKRARKKKLVYYFSQRVQVSSRFNSKIYTNERNTKLEKYSQSIILHLSYIQVRMVLHIFSKIFPNHFLNILSTKTAF